jgi:hypothetical protein
MRSLGFTMSPDKYPKLNAWLAAMRRDKLFLNDARRTGEFMKTIATNTSFERERIFWRGDRIEWLLARGFDDWFFAEVRAGRTICS